MIDSLVDCLSDAEIGIHSLSSQFLSGHVISWSTEMAPCSSSPDSLKASGWKYQRMRVDSTGIFSQGSMNPDRWSWQDALQFIPLEFYSVFEAKVEAQKRPVGDFFLAGPSQVVCSRLGVKCLRCLSRAPISRNHFVGGGNSSVLHH